MFDGKVNFQQRRNVSLGGRSKQKQIEKRDVLQRARAEREGRAQERVRTQGAIKLQSAWRAKASQRSLKRRLRSDWDQKVHDIEKLQQLLTAAGAQFLLPEQHLRGLLRNFLGFALPHISCQDDVQRLVRMTQFLRQGLQASDAGYSWLAKGGSDDELEGNCWVFQMKSLLWLCLETMTRPSAHAMNSPSSSSVQSSTAIDQSLSDFWMELRASFIPSNWQISLSGDGIERLKIRCWKVFLWLGGGNELFFMQLAKVMGAGSAAQGRVQLMLDVTREILSVGDQRQKDLRGSSSLFSLLLRSYFYFSKYFLSSFLLASFPLRQQLLSAVFGEGTQVRWLLLSLERHQSYLLPKKGSRDGLEVLVANLMDISLLGSLDFEVARHLIFILKLVVPLLPPHAIGPEDGPASASFASNDYDEESDDEASEVNLESFQIDSDSFLEKLVRQALRAQASQVQLAGRSARNSETWSKVSEGIRRIADSRLLSLLFEAALQEVQEGMVEDKTVDGSERMQVEGEGAGKAPFAVCQLYAAVLCQQGAEFYVNARKPPTGLALSILNAIAFSNPSNPILRRLWLFLRPMVEKASSAGTATPEVSSLLFILFAGYSHLLLAQDDEEFYQKQFPFSLSEVRAIGAFVRGLLYQMFWVDGSSLSPPYKVPDLLLLISATKLYNQLYDRNCRRQFTPPEFWHWPRLPGMEGNGDGTGVSRKVVPILTALPQVLPFDDRVLIFKRLLEAEKAKRQFQGRDAAVWLKIKRQRIYEESFESWSELGTQHRLKYLFKISLVNEHGLDESGIDGGGLLKEYMDLLSSKAFDPQYALFLETSDHLLLPNPSSHLVVDSHLEHFRFLGRIVGKGLYEGILIQPRFALPFLNKLLGKYNYIDDLQSLDPELYRNLHYLKTYDGDWEDLSLNFEMVQNEFGQARGVELCPNGGAMPVTKDNVIRYIHLMADYKLNVQTSQQCMAFLSGFRDLIPSQWIRMFNPQELQLLLGGTDDLNIEDMQQHTAYSSGYHPSQAYIDWFWEVVREFSVEDRAALLKFITSCPRQPLLGFNHLNPPLTIQQVRVQDDSERLPSSATCVNLLKLPKYSSKEVLRAKLLYSIHSNAGFELS